MELVEGLSVAKRYRLDRRIGVGGMGEVWAATQTLTRKTVALKFLKGAQAADVDLRRRFLREARAVCAVRHPNVVEVHDVLELEDGAPVMVMELLQGESLEERLGRHGRMTVGDLASVMLRVVAAVGTAHALGIVHRDLKPDNIFLASTPEGVEVKVLDFGIAKLTASEGDAALTGGLTSTGTMLGTPYYMSPEQAFGERKVDHRADIWSLGIILYRCLTGVLPTRADNLGQILKIIMTNGIRPIGELAPGLSPDLADLITRMLSQSPAGRPADLRELKEVLERHTGVVVDGFGAPAAVTAASSDSRVTSVPLVSTGAPVVGPRSAAKATGRGRAIAVVAACLLVGAGTAFFVLRSSRSEGAAAGLVSAESVPESAEPSGVVVTPVASVSLAAASAPAPTAAPTALPNAAPPRPTTRPLGAATPIRKPPEPSTSSAPQVPTPQPGPPSIGGVVEKPPF